MTLTEDSMTLNNMILRSGGDTIPDDSSPAIESDSIKFAHERNLYRLTNKLFQSQESQIGILDDISGSNTSTQWNWYDSYPYSAPLRTSASGTLAAGDNVGLNSPGIEFDFGDSLTSSFSQVFPAVSGHIHRCSITFHIPYYARITTKTRDNVTNGLSTVGWQWRSGPANGINGVTWATISDGRKMQQETDNLSGGDIIAGEHDGSIVVPVSPGNITQIRLKSFGQANWVSNIVFDRVVILDSWFTAQII